MIKRLFAVCICLFSFMVFAQRGTASPYSFYGIGSLKFKGTVENRSMGGISVYLDSIHVNLRNPAAYAGKNVEDYPFDNESRPVKFTVAGTMSQTTFKSESEQANTGTAIFDYFAMTIPVGKFGFGFGLLPFTSVGYKLDDINSDGDLTNRFRGEGGVNRVFAGLGYQLNRNFSIGVDFNYNWGNIQNSTIELAYTPEGEIVQFQTREENSSNLSGVSLNFGIAYRGMITERLEVMATSTYSPQYELTSQNTRSLSTIALDILTDREIEISTIDTDLERLNLQQTELQLPYRFSIGGGVGRPKQWFVGAEYTIQNISEFSNPLYSNDITNYENASEFAIGGFFIPRYNAFSGYFKRVVYRAGFNYANTGLVIKGESINQFGISFGVGVPVGGYFSNANIGFEVGQRGTTRQNLIQENFINFNLSLSLNSRWFRKRKFD